MSFPTVPLSSGPKTTTQSSSPTQKLQGAFWLQSGDVILETTTQPITEYRVHREILVLHSEKLKDVIESTTPVILEHISPTRKFIPIQVSGDACDWDRVLPILYGSPSFEVGQLLALYRLDSESQFGFHRVRPKMEQYIAAIFPLYFDEWKQSYILNNRWTEYIAGHEFELLHELVRRNSIRLPTAHYLCLMNRSDSEINSGRDAPFGPEYLTANLKASLNKARGIITNKCAQLTYGWWTSPSEPHSDGCGAVRRQVLKKIARRDYSIQDALLTVPNEILSSCKDLCQECKLKEKKTREDGMKALFYELASYFRESEWLDETHFKA